MNFFDMLVPFGRLENGVLEISESFRVRLEPPCREYCTLFRIEADCLGQVLPRVSFALTGEGQSEPLYHSHTYPLGKKSEQTLRIPPLFRPELFLEVCFDLPEGGRLRIKRLELTPDPAPKAPTGGLRFNAHLGFWGLAPNNTLPAFELAARCGFAYCIAVPKVTLDGELVCIHDDTINKTARNPLGDPPEEKFYVREHTYAELLKWEYGSYKYPLFKGERLPLLSEFFDICAQSGMHPMFSTHPGLTYEQWQRVRRMLLERELLSDFHVKSFRIERLQAAYEVLGTDIEGYTYDRREPDPMAVSDLLSSGIDTTACRCGIEHRFNHCTEGSVRAITASGLFAAAYDIKRRDIEEYERLISYGVTEFTEDYHCSMGLDF